MAGLDIAASLSRSSIRFFARYFQVRPEFARYRRPAMKNF